MQLDCLLHKMYPINLKSVSSHKNFLPLKASIPCEINREIFQTFPSIPLPIATLVFRSTGNKNELLYYTIFHRDWCYLVTPFLMLLPKEISELQRRVCPYSFSTSRIRNRKSNRRGEPVILHSDTHFLEESMQYL